MSQTGNSAKKKSILQSPGCFGGILGAFIGFGVMMIIGLLVAGYTWYQINTEDASFFGGQAPEIEEPVGELPGEENPAPALGQESASPSDEESSAQSNPLEECDGAKIVTITYGAAENTKQGHCRYLIAYQSRSASKDVHIFHYKTHTNTSTGSNHEWYHEQALFAGNDYSDYQTIFASGEISTVDRVAFIFTNAGCNWVEHDQDALDLIAQELSNPCR